MEILTTSLDINRAICSSRLPAKAQCTVLKDEEERRRAREYQAAFSLKSQWLETVACRDYWTRIRVDITRKTGQSKRVSYQS